MGEAEIEADLQIQVYMPSREQFADMKMYIEYIAQDSGIRNGICKVSSQCCGVL